MNRTLRAKLGFSLVELMIVVAIIGVLATIGIPTFRTMVQKAKKSEAKVALGALYTTEVAFFSEYGAYGNLLDKIGFELDGATATRTYQTGFMSAACAADTNIGTNALPTRASTAQGSSLNLAFPAYYTGSVTLVASGKAPTAGCVAAAVTGTGQSFTAAAAAMISTRAGAVADVWVINENRALANVVDGIK